MTTFIAIAIAIVFEMFNVDANVLASIVACAEGSSFDTFVADPSLLADSLIMGIPFLVLFIL